MDLDDAQPATQQSPQQVSVCSPSVPHEGDGERDALPAVSTAENSTPKKCVQSVRALATDELEAQPTAPCTHDEDTPAHQGD